LAQPARARYRQPTLKLNLYSGLKSFWTQLSRMEAKLLCLVQGLKPQQIAHERQSFLWTLLHHLIEQLHFESLTTLEAS
jgi:hypothetical protein